MAQRGFTSADSERLIMSNNQKLFMLFLYYWLDSEMHSTYWSLRQNALRKQHFIFNDIDFFFFFFFGNIYPQVGVKTNGKDVYFHDDNAHIQLWDVPGGLEIESEHPVFLMCIYISVLNFLIVIFIYAPTPLCVLWLPHCNICIHIHTLSCVNNQQLNAFVLVDTVETTCWSSNRPSEWERKLIQVILASWCQTEGWSKNFRNCWLLLSFWRITLSRICKEWSDKGKISSEQ